MRNIKKYKKKRRKGKCNDAFIALKCVNMYAQRDNIKTWWKNIYTPMRIKYVDIEQIFVAVVIHNVYYFIYF